MEITERESRRGQKTAPSLWAGRVTRLRWLASPRTRPWLCKLRLHQHRRHQSDEDGPPDSCSTHGGDAQCNTGSRTELAGDLRVAAVEIHDALNDGQTQSSAS